ncbi:MAG: 3-deoxy-7-phosphoheptulonate synthase [Selenomonadaceae bacterium]|nr:3-deoxy-7-phosphoheptulonate synthase [Selenomonadaceae bacterium]MBQ3725888.1 3-deoxy-7-phosphoheptulonate synthase [Selenomonadaceae bacterium]MBQ9497388.1 3-deoxy-7-phosphoheptulonate synthase [Selenomonadaceae bacterium]
MIVVMKPGSTPENLSAVVKKIEAAGLRTHLSKGEEVTIVGVIGDKKIIANLELQMMAGVEKTVRITEKYKLVSRDFHPEDTVVDAGGIKIGGNEVVVMAGPCAVESLEQLREAASAVKACGAKFLRGGAFKPRTSPYDFQGLGEEGLKLLRKVADEFDLRVVTEIVDKDDIETFCKYADILQVGARNMQNFQMLKALGKCSKPILLKRGLSATISEWLNAAEYIMSGGNEQVIFCERGIRTYETFTRNTLDLSAVAAVKELSHLPIVVDPSHGTGRWKMVAPMARAALAAGADGLIIEVHPHPEKALSDGDQSLTSEAFSELMQSLGGIAKVMGKTI